MFWLVVCMLGCTFVPPGLICIHSLTSVHLSKGMWSLSEVETSMWWAVFLLLIGSLWRIVFARGDHIIIVSYNLFTFCSSVQDYKIRMDMEIVIFWGVKRSNTHKDVQQSCLPVQCLRFQHNIYLLLYMGCRQWSGPMLLKSSSLILAENKVSL